MINSKASVVALHIIGWLFFLSLPLFFIIAQNGTNSTAAIFSNPVKCLGFIVYIIIFYLHTYVLLPALFFKRKYVWYVLSVLVLLLAVALLKPFDSAITRQLPVNTGRGFNPYNDHPPPPGGQFQPQLPPPQAGMPVSGMQPPASNRRSPRVDIVSIALLILVLALSTALAVTRRWRLAVQQAANAEADKANAELSFLKAQINPHFLFNTLNNIYTMALLHDEHTAESIMMLSNIMRYVTDEATGDMVPLQQEVDCIHNYIDLQRLRLGAKNTIALAMTGNFEQQKIAPLVLMTFVENVFKYGTSNSEPSPITINLSAGEGGIHFFCRNKIYPEKNTIESTGIGIANTVKRLERLYPNKYELNIDTAGGLYTVTLSLLP